MLRQRIITGALMAAVCVAVVLLAPVPVFIVFVGVIVALAGWEWANFCDIHGQLGRWLYAGALITVGCAIGFSLSWIPMLTAQTVFIASGIWWAIALLWVQGYPASAVLWRSQWMRALMGGMVILPAWLGLTVLRQLEMGQWLVLAVVVIVAAADIGAYFSGRAFGRRKLAPAVSPGKSWEGVYGGVGAVAIVTVIFIFLTGHDGLFAALVITLSTGLVSVLGDLLESMLKRHRGIKDSSQLLPGHGGILDRIDGLLAAVPIFALALMATGWRL